VTREVALSDHATERSAEHDRPFDLERVTPSNEVIGPRVQRPLLPRPTIAPAVTAVVVEDDLRDAISDHRVVAL
jgi:hypothetical protein